MRATIFVLVSGLFLLFTSATIAEEGGMTYIHAGTLIAVPGQPAKTNQTLIVENGRIVNVVDGYVAPENEAATIVNLRSQYVLPGLIDLHVHMTSNSSPADFGRAVNDNPATLAMLAANNARKTVEAGFTTVLDMGTGRRAHEIAIYAVRDAIHKGLAIGPRIIAAGSPISSPGNSRTGLYVSEVESAVGPEAVCSGADDCRRAVREQVKRGADVINFYNTGSLLSAPSHPQTFTDEEMLAIVETAHALGRRVVADGGNTPGDSSGIDAAINAGADWIDTAEYVEPGTWKLAAKRGIYFSPHLFALHISVGDTRDTLSDGSMGWLPRPVLEFLFDLKQQRPSAVEAIAAGVPLAFGSDPGVFPHGWNAGEFKELVKLGLTPSEAISMATINAADVLGLEAEIGTLESGKFADLIALDDNPIEDVRALCLVRVAIRNGVVLYRGDFPLGTKRPWCS